MEITLKNNILAAYEVLDGLRAYCLTQGLDTYSSINTDGATAYFAVKGGKPYFQLPEPIVHLADEHCTPASLLEWGENIKAAINSTLVEWRKARRQELIEELKALED